MITVEVSQGNIQDATADTVVVNLFQGVTSPGGATGAVDRALNGAVSELIRNGDISGKTGEVGILYPRDAMTAKRVLVVGLGKADEFNLEGVRQAAAAATRRATELGAEHLATIIHGAGIAGLPTEAAAEATVLGSLLAAYTYEADKEEEEGKKPISSLAVVEYNESKIEPIERAVAAATSIASGVYLTRDLVNMPPNVATPTKLAKEAKKIAEAFGMRVTIGGRKWAKERGMGAFLAVAKGAGEKPKFIILEHNVDREDLDTVVLVGKGITFDTGGISIKPGERMGLMKSDMAGAAAVLGTMKAIGGLDIPLHIIGITPATENMPDADAYRPADVIRASNGKTIEIISTDAEGRMILADGLVYARGYQPQAVIDLATLTGASVVALGRGIAAGLFSNSDELRDAIEDASLETSERIWPLPLWDEYKKAIESDVADMKNSGGRFGGVATSAVFLQEFTDYPWAHLDIAGVALSEKQRGYIPSGATGFGVRLLCQFLRDWSPTGNS